MHIGGDLGFAEKTERIACNNTSPDVFGNHHKTRSGVFIT